MISESRFTAALLFLFIISKAQVQSVEDPLEPSFRVVFYNLENLFHPDDEPDKRDDEFTAEGNRRWTNWRYTTKLNRMAKVIRIAGEWHPPVLVGLCELENYQTLEDLVATPPLRKSGYEIAHYESPDRRGIDTGLLIQKQRFAVVQSCNIAVRLKDDEDYKTRDILYVKGYLMGSQCLHLFVNHWPSRRGGQSASEHLRVNAAQTARNVIDSILHHNPEAHILVMGDFNDEWYNNSLFRTLGAGSLDSSATLVNLMAGMNENYGTHRYAGHWAYLDQMIVSASLLDGKGLEVKDHRAHVVQHAFLFEEDKKYPGLVPMRTFKGFKYQEGFSDHLPIYLDLVIVGD